MPMAMSPVFGLSESKRRFAAVLGKFSAVLCRGKEVRDSRLRFWTL
jgi:hypothetical protein